MLKVVDSVGRSFCSNRGSQAEGAADNGVNLTEEILKNKAPIGSAVLNDALFVFEKKRERTDKTHIPS